MTKEIEDIFEEDSNKDCLSFKKETFFMTGYRPTIGWIVALGLFIVFPFQFTIIILTALTDLDVLSLPSEQMNALTFSLIPIVVTMLTARTVEKIKGIDDYYKKEEVS